MSERVRRIAARLALAILGAALGINVAHAAPGKPAAPIAIAYVFATQPALGVPFDVQISARGGDGIAELALSVQPGNGVQAGTPRLTASSADGGERSWTVAATAYGDGTLYLGLLVQGTAGDQHPAGNLLVPIRIGTTTAAAETTAPPPDANPTRQRIIVLPADGVRTGR
jgi:hypothetical protein